VKGKVHAKSWRPMFFKETINSEHCSQLFLTPFLGELTEKLKPSSYFMQDNATC
jgi:hypothetical protein